MSSLQRQVGLFAIPLRSRQHANRTCQNQTGSREFSLPGTSRAVAALFRWTLAFPQPLEKSGSRDLALRSPLRGGVPPPQGARIMTPDESEQAARPRAQAYRTRMRAERDRQIIGSHGPASPCKRIDPRTGEVIEVIAPSTKTPTRRIR